MALGITVTKRTPKQGNQIFGQYRAVICDIEIDAANSEYVALCGFPVKAADFGLSSIVAIIITSCVYDPYGTAVGRFAEGNVPMMVEVEGGGGTSNVHLPDLNNATDYANGYVGQPIRIYDAAAPTVGEYARVKTDDAADPSVCDLDSVLTFTPAAGDRAVLENMAAIRCFGHDGTEEAKGTPSEPYYIRAIVLGN